MKWKRLLIAVAILGIAITSAVADDSVLIESKNVPRGASDVLVHIKIANSDTISLVALPLEIREITQGSFVTSMEVSFQERLTSALQDYRFANLYSTTDGICGETGEPAYYIPDASALDTAIAVTASPSGLILAAIRYALGWSRIG